MDLRLIRTYHSKGVNGVLLFEGQELCRTIELPWRNNEPRISCIPEGRYRLRKRYSEKFKWHFEICDVPGRQYILIHPANCVELELKGCIAPVLHHHGAGRGQSSLIALSRLKALLYPRLDQGQKVYLTLLNTLT